MERKDSALRVRRSFESPWHLVTRRGRWDGRADGRANAEQAS